MPTVNAIAIRDTRIIGIASEHYLITAPAHDKNWTIQKADVEDDDYLSCIALLRDEAAVLVGCGSGKILKIGTAE